MIDHTEAMTVVDVNTGRYVGRKYLEDTILKTNLEACREVVRQLRVRDIGGIIVIDFIDMSRKENREQVLTTLEAELAKDRTKTYVVELSPLGLVEMTRQNITDGIRGIMTRPCPTCAGEGVVLSDETLAIEVERRLRRFAESLDAEAFLVEVHPRVAAHAAGRRGRSTAAAREPDRQVVQPRGRGARGGRRGAGQRRGQPRGHRAGVSAGGAGQEIEVPIDEVHAYDRRDGVARLDGYPVCVTGAAELVGTHVRVVIDEATRYCAVAHLVEGADG